MDGVDRRKSFKERLGLKGMACCGSTFGLLRPSTVNVSDDDEEETEDVIQIQPTAANTADTGGTVNLATALAMERLLRSDTVERTSTTMGLVPGTPLRVSLMRLLEESNGVDESTVEKSGVGSDCLCCVCMGRKKGSAFIPCGHTFCRVCSREIWRNRGSCPLCNRSILEILDIF